MAATDCSLDVARATLRDLCGDVIQAVELLLLLAPHEREKVALPDTATGTGGGDQEKLNDNNDDNGHDNGEKHAEAEAEFDYSAYTDYNDYSDYSDYSGGAGARVEVEEESADWRDYVTPTHHHQRGGGGGGGARRRGDAQEDEQNSSRRREAEAAQQQQKQKKKSDEPTPEERLRILRFVFASCCVSRVSCRVSWG